MVRCPSCGQRNIPGVDLCDSCGHSLSELSHPKPNSPIERMILRDPVSVLEPRAPVVVPADTSVAQAIGFMSRHKVGCMLVMEHDTLVGIFTERDVLRKIAPRAKELAVLPIRDFMTPAPETLDLGDKVAFALHRMDVGNYRHVPILHEGRVAGVVSIRDVLRYVSENLFGENHG